MMLLKLWSGPKELNCSGKNMHIEYCKSKSEAAAIADNTYVSRNRRPAGTGADGKPPAEAVN